MDEITALFQNLISVSRAKLFEIRESDRAEAVAALLGRFYKCRTSYPIPRDQITNDESDYWWFYFHVTRVDEIGRLRACSFETDKFGVVLIKYDDLLPSLSGVLTEISREEFQSAWQALLSRAIEIVDGAAARPVSSSE